MQSTDHRTHVAAVRSPAAAAAAAAAAAIALSEELRREPREVRIDEPRKDFERAAEAGKPSREAATYLPHRNAQHEERRARAPRLGLIGRASERVSE